MGVKKPMIVQVGFLFSLTTSPLTSVRWFPCYAVYFCWLPTLCGVLAITVRTVVALEIVGTTRTKPISIVQSFELSPPSPSSVAVSDVCVPDVVVGWNASEIVVAGVNNPSQSEFVRVCAGNWKRHHDVHVAWNEHGSYSTTIDVYKVS